MSTQYFENRLLDRTNSTYTPISYEDIKVKGQESKEGDCPSMNLLCDRIQTWHE